MLVAIAAISGFSGAFLVSCSLCDRAEAKRQRRAALALMGADVQGRELSLSVTGWKAWCLRKMASHEMSSFGAADGFVEQLIERRAKAPRLELILRKAGLSAAVTPEAVVRMQVACALACACAGAIVGALLSFELCLLGSGCGLVLGWRAPLAALRAQRKARADEMEGQLCRLLEVLALGLRSGLSFDRSLALFTSRFKGSLSSILASAHTQWDHALCSRAQGLRFVAESYDSPVLDRLVESIIRAQRFGTPLSEVLEMDEAEVRAVRKAALEEKVAKVPVKMLVPIAALILPAMLILVMGPVGLDLMSGFAL